MIGCVDVVSHVVVSGWCVDTADPDRTEVEVFADGEQVGRAYANQFRKDLFEQGIGNGRAAFEILVDLPLGPDPIRISVRLKNGAVELPGSPVALEPVATKSLADYQEEIRSWLDQRFGHAGIRNGIYIAHQPIYGYRAGYADPGWPLHYQVTYNIMRCFSKLRFTTLLDTGGAEGYTAALAKHLFGCSVISCDLSAEACRRAEEIYGIETRQLDIQHLPFESESHDVVLASETLEHVIDFKKAIEELLRVARKAVVITVPHDSLIEVCNTLRRREIHGHIHYFDLNAFNYLKQRGLSVTVAPMISFSRISCHLRAWMEHNSKPLPGATGLEPFSRRVRSKIYSAVLKMPMVSAGCLKLDHRMSRINLDSGYGGVLCTIYKDAAAIRPGPSRSVSFRDILSFTVPYHRPELSVPGKQTCGG